MPGMCAGGPGSAVRMVLQADQLATDRDRLAASTRASYEQNVRHWVNYCLDVEDRSPLLWDDLTVFPKPFELLKLRAVAKRFWQHLSRSYAVGTIKAYWAAVLALHKDWLQGISLDELGITFPELGNYIAIRSTCPFVFRIRMSSCRRHHFPAIHQCGKKILRSHPW